MPTVYTVNWKRSAANGWSFWQVRGAAITGHLRWATDRNDWPAEPIASVHRPVLAFPRMHGFWGKVRWIISSLRLFWWVFLKEFSSRASIPLFRPGLVYSGPKSWDDCGREYPAELRVSSFLWYVPILWPGQHSQPTQTPLCLYWRYYSECSVFECTGDINGGGGGGRGAKV